MSLLPALAAHKRQEKEEEYSHLRGCLGVFSCNCESSVALTRIMVQANEDESFLFILQSHALCMCVYMCERETVHFNVLCVTDSRHGGWKRTFCCGFSGSYSEHFVM